MRWNFRENKVNRNRDNEPTYKNPLYAKTNWQAYVIARLGTFGWLTLLGLLLIIYAIFYSPWLSIINIKIDGTNTSTAAIIGERFVSWQMSQRKWAIFRQNNLLLFDSAWLKENLQSKYSLSEVVVKKKLPHTLEVTVHMKAPALVWVTSDAYYYVDETGNVSTQVSISESTVSLPHVFNDSNEAPQQGSQVLTPEKIQFITAMTLQLNQLTGVKILSYSMPHNLSTQVNAKTEAGYVIYFDSSISLDTQMEKLRGVLDTKIKESKPKEYVDLRIGDRVYIK
jgi:cell division septal protein FtsQ